MQGKTRQSVYKQAEKGLSDLQHFAESYCLDPRPQATPR